ncbi:DNA helicase PIF1, ATP-dependent [Tanacetum coccineum]
MSNKAAPTTSDNKAAHMTEVSSGIKAAHLVDASQMTSHLYLDQLEVDVKGTIIVMIGRKWDVNAVTGRYLSTDFVVSDAKYPFQLLDFDRIEPTNNKYLIDVTGYVTNVGWITYQKSGSRTLDFYHANQRFYLLLSRNGVILGSSDTLRMAVDQNRWLRSRELHAEPMVKAISVPVVYHNLGPPSHQCRSCHAIMWYEERDEKSKKGLNPIFTICCKDGKVLLSKFNETPPPLNKLLDYNEPATSKFRDQIRMGSLLPKEGIQPRFAQLYFFDTQNEVRNRMSTFIDKDTTDSVDETMVISLIQMLDHYSHVAKAFQMARDWCSSNDSVNFELMLHSERKTSRQYNSPTVFEVAALITNDFGDGEPTRDIIVTTVDGPPKCNLELHPAYMALQYPLLFPYGEDGFHEKTPYHSKYRQQKNKTGFCNNERQYLVDTFTAIKEQRLKWTRNNQDTLRVDLYHNLCDAVTRGDTSAAGLGKRIVLLRTFTGSPRYMMHNYQDAMALCREYGNPNLFMTFTSNPKWPEIAEILAYIPGQKSHDRPEVFGDSRVVVYVIEFHKRGLPHAHILLWLKEHYKCKTPNQIDDIISAEIPSPIHDPDRYKVVTEYMLHVPCGKDVRYAPCTIDGKCAKHFPKSFLAKTTIDEDGYAHYRRRDRPDRATVVIQENIRNGTAMATEQVLELNFHLQNQNTITLRDSEVLPALLERDGVGAISEASLWALEPQLRDIFVTMLLFCDVSRPLKLWEENWQDLSEDILDTKRKLFKSLSDFQDLPRPDPRNCFIASTGREAAHSRFVIPLELMENNTCGIKQNTQLAELMQEVQLIIWDEAPMTQKYAFQALDITLRDILGY